MSVDFSICNPYNRVMQQEKESERALNWFFVLVLVTVTTNKLSHSLGPGLDSIKSYMIKSAQLLFSRSFSLSYNQICVENFTEFELKSLTNNVHCHNNTNTYPISLLDTHTHFQQSFVRACKIYAKTTKTRSPVHVCVLYKSKIVIRLKWNGTQNNKLSVWVWVCFGNCDNNPF